MGHRDLGGVPRRGCPRCGDDGQRSDCRRARAASRACGSPRGVGSWLVRRRRAATYDVTTLRGRLMARHGPLEPGMEVRSLPPEPDPHPVLLRDAGPSDLGAVVEVAGIGLIVVSARTAEHGVVAADVVEHVETTIVARATVDDVVADDAGHDVAAGSAEGRVVAAAAVHQVEVGAAANHVVPVAPVHEVVLRAAEDLVEAEGAEEAVAAVVAVDDVVA